MKGTGSLMFDDFDKVFIAVWLATFVFCVVFWAAVIGVAIYAIKSFS